MINANRHHQNSDDEHHQHPRLRDPKTLNEETGQINQASGGCNFRNVIECPLPANPACLFLIRQHRHVGSVGSNVVGCTTKGYHGKQSDGDCEEGWQM